MKIRHIFTLLAAFSTAVTICTAQETSPSPSPQQLKEITINEQPHISLLVPESSPSPKPGRVEDSKRKRISVSLQYTPTNGPAYSVSVPQADITGLIFPLKVPNAVDWIVAVNAIEDDKKLLIDIVDHSTAVGVKGDYYMPQVLNTHLDLDYDRPITILRSSAYTLEITLSTK